MRSATRLGLWAALACALSLCACARRAEEAAAAGGEPQYLSPPRITATSVGSDGALVIAGQAPGGAEVRLQAPDGAAFAAASGEDGLWSITVPGASQVRMFAMEGDDGGRLLHADGALLLLPAPGPAAVITRPGYGSKVIGPGAGRLRLEGLDFDGAGGAAASGTTASGASVRLFIDHQPAGVGQADGEGRFTVLDLDPRAVPASPGRHLFGVTTSGGATQETTVDVTASEPPPGKVFIARREGDAWSVTWRIPGGGAQTSVIFDAARSGG